MHFTTNTRKGDIELIAGYFFTGARMTPPAQGKIAEADPLYARAVEIQENHLGPDHPHLGQNLVQRAIILQAQVRKAVSEGRC